ncbi:MAG: peptidoglycan-binding protein [Eubacteriales bacterium]|nr:peptidoglycan-binding protein [Eubacteriales bacterium]
MFKKRNRTGIRAKHLLSFLIALCLFTSVFTVSATESVNYGMTTAKDVFFRAYPSTASNVVWYDKLPQNWVAKILGTTEKNGAKWYHVETTTTKDPNAVKGGYIHADFFRELTTEETEAWSKNPVQLLWLAALTDPTPSPTVKPVETPSPEPTTPSQTYAPGEDGPGEDYKTGFILITKARVNFRDAVEGSSTGQLDKGTILPYYGVEIVKGKYKWIYALDTQSQQYGYVRNDCYKFVTQDGTVTEGPGWQTPPPYTPDGPITAGSYAMCTTPAANLRQVPNGYALTIVPQDAVLKVLGPETSGWYPVSYDGYSGYIQKEYIRMMTGAEIAEYLSGNSLPQMPTNPPGGTSTFGDGYVTITASLVNLRDNPNGSSMLKMEKNSVLPYFGTPQYAGGVNWLYVYYPPANLFGYVHEDFFRYSDYAGNPTNPSQFATPTPNPYPTTPITGGYVKLILPGVNLRETPGGRSQTQLALGTVLPYSGAEQYYGGYRWVYVTDPTTRIRGYVRSDCYKFTDSTGQDLGATTAPILPPVTDVPFPQQNTGELELIKGGVNFRETAGGRIIGRLDKGTRLKYYGTTQLGGYTWYYCSSNLGLGYLRADMVKIISKPQDPTPTQTPNQTGVNGYLITTKGNVNLRVTPGGNWTVRVPKGKVYPITGPIVSQGGYNWSFVEAEGHTGYLRSDCVRHLSKTEIDNYLKGIMPNIQAPSGPDPNYQASGNIILLENYVNIRVSPALDAQKLGQVNKGAVLPYFNTVSSGGNSWFYVQYAGRRAYVMARYARILSLEEQENMGILKPTPTATPSATLSPEDRSNIAVTVMDRVKLRNAPNMTSGTKTIIYKEGTKITLTGKTNATQDGYFWYSAALSNIEGWIRSDMIRILSKEEAGVDTEAPIAPDDKPTATYRTLRLGATGADVTKLQNMLIALGLMPNGSASGIYDSRTEQAVREYQKLEGLFVDGVAGQNTQNALYNTKPPVVVPPEGTVDTTLYPVEVVDWYTGDIQSVWRKGDIAVITDVRTGLSFRSKRWSGGYHADVEPLTAADTEVLCRIYGVKDAQEISEKNMWQRRPLWVTLKGRTFAASMYGVPHNYPAGDTIPNNNFNGQFCVHFLNSRTHTSNRIDENHMKAIREAYDKAPSKK